MSPLWTEEYSIPCMFGLKVRILDYYTQNNLQMSPLWTEEYSIPCMFELKVRILDYYTQNNLQMSPLWTEEYSIPCLYGQLSCENIRLLYIEQPSDVSTVN